MSYKTDPFFNSSFDPEKRASVLSTNVACKAYAKGSEKEKHLAGQSTSGARLLVSFLLSCALPRKLLLGNVKLCLLGIAESEGYTNVVTGCVNLAVLMPVLAVMMVSLLLNVHFLIQWRRRQRFLLSEEEIYQLHLAREAIAVNHEDQEEENVEVKKKKFFGGRFKKCKKEGDKREKDHENTQDSSNLDKDKGEAIEMQESKDFLNTQDGSCGLDIPREQDSSWEKKRPWEHDDDVTRADDNHEILRLDDILRVQETSTPVQDSMNEWESPRSIDSAGTKGIPCLEDILREQDSSLPTQDHSHELDSPRTQESPRTKEIPRLEEIFSASEGEAKENVHDKTRPDVSGAHHRSGSLQAPRIAEFFLPSDESDAERQSVTSEEPLVSHYMEKMDFEKENEDEHGEEPLVSHYMEKMDFEKGNEDNVQDQEPLVSYYKEKIDFEESKNDEEPVLK